MLNNIRIAELGTNSNFRSLHTVPGSSDVIDDFAANKTSIGERWTVPQVGYMPEWQAFPVETCEAQADIEDETARPKGDFPHYWEINFGVLTNRSYNVLRDLISPFVEFLPLASSEGEFVALNVTRFVDALNQSESSIKWFPQLPKDAGKPRVAHHIQRFAFHLDRLENEVIFRLPEMPFGGHVFVTHRFMDEVEKHQLLGFRFTEVWPPNDTRQKFLQKRLEQQHRT